MGTDHCEDNVHPHRDPHAHIAMSSEWTHSGIIDEIRMSGRVTSSTTRRYPALKAYIKVYMTFIL